MPIDLQSFEQQVRAARERYGREKPPLVRDGFNSRYGAPRKVILATPAGSCPDRVGVSDECILTVAKWDEKRYFCTLELGDQRLIVKSFGCLRRGGCAYRRWIGAHEGFAQRLLPFRSVILSNPLPRTAPVPVSLWVPADPPSRGRDSAQPKMSTSNLH